VWRNGLSICLSSLTKLIILLTIADLKKIILIDFIQQCISFDRSLEHGNGYISLRVKSKKARRPCLRGARIICSLPSMQSSQTIIEFDLNLDNTGGKGSYDMSRTGV
jgi:hypothetical protein